LEGELDDPERHWDEEGPPVLARIWRHGILQLPRATGMGSGPGDDHAMMPERC
jgi:hypothetical protein